MKCRDEVDILFAVILHRCYKSVHYISNCLECLYRINISPGSVEWVDES